MSSKDIFQSDNLLKKLTVENISSIVASVNNGGLEIIDIPPSKKKHPVTAHNAIVKRSIPTGVTSNANGSNNPSEKLFVSDCDVQTSEKIHKSARKISKVENKIETQSLSSKKTHLRDKSLKRIVESQSQMLSEAESLRQRENYERINLTQTQV